jgi:hypothetical protein
MTDLQPLILLSNEVTADPTEEHLEAFLQAYNATQPPDNQAEFIIYEVLGDYTIDVYLDPECTCNHEQSENL